MRDVLTAGNRLLVQERVAQIRAAEPDPVLPLMTLNPPRHPAGLRCTHRVLEEALGDHP